MLLDGFLGGIVSSSSVHKVGSSRDITFVSSNESHEVTEISSPSEELVFIEVLVHCGEHELVSSRVGFHILDHHLLEFFGVRVEANRVSILDAISLLIFASSALVQETSQFGSVGLEVLNGVIEGGLNS